MNVINLFKTFAVYSSRNGVLKNFTRTNPALPQYDNLKAWAEALPETGLIPEIDDFIFGQDVEQIGERLRTCKGYFLFVEYGAQTTPPPDRERKRITSTMVSCILGFMPNAKDWDLASETIINNTTEELIYQLANLIAAADVQRCSHNRLMDSAITVMPIEPSLCYGAVGWQLAFSIIDFKIN